MKWLDPIVEDVVVPWLDIVIEGEEVLEVEDKSFRILETLGHTSGDISIHVPKEHVVLAGDLVCREVYPPTLGLGA